MGEKEITREGKMEAFWASDFFEGQSGITGEFWNSDGKKSFFKQLFTPAEHGIDSNFYFVRTGPNSDESLVQVIWDTQFREEDEWNPLNYRKTIHSNFSLIPGSEKSKENKENCTGATEILVFKEEASRTFLMHLNVNF